MIRRVYPVDLLINGVRIDRVIIDPHYERKHSGSVSDEVILKLVFEMNGNRYDHKAEVGSFRYFVSEKVIHEGRLFRLIWLLEEGQTYIGVVNAHRR